MAQNTLRSHADFHAVHGRRLSVGGNGWFALADLCHTHQLQVEPGHVRVTPDFLFANWSSKAQILD